MKELSWEKTRKEVLKQLRVKYRDPVEDLEDAVQEALLYVWEHERKAEKSWIGLVLSAAESRLLNAKLKVAADREHEAEYLRRQENDDSYPPHHLNDARKVEMELEGEPSKDKRYHHRKKFIDS